MRHSAREPRLSLGLFGPVLHVRHQVDELLGYRRYAGLLPGEGEEMARPPRWANPHRKEDEERPRTLGHYPSVRERNFLSGDVLQVKGDGSIPLSGPRTRSLTSMCNTKRAREEGASSRAVPQR